MTRLEVIHETDSTYPNPGSQGQKTRWLMRCDQELYNHIINKYEDYPLPPKEEVFGENVDTVCIMPAPYDEAYIFWIAAKLCYIQEEMDRYNKHISAYENRVEQFEKFCMEHYKVKQCGRIRF